MGGFGDAGRLWLKFRPNASPCPALAGFARNTCSKRWIIGAVSFALFPNFHRRCHSVFEKVQVELGERRQCTATVSMSGKRYDTRRNAYTAVSLP